MLVALLGGQMMASIDGSIVTVAAPAMRTGLHASSADIQLIVSAYLLTTGVLFVTCARLGDVVGPRRSFFLGVAVFTVASLTCGLAVSPTMLIIARVVQATGAALLMPQVFSLIHLHWHGDERRSAIGMYSTVLALGVVLGQVGGGLVAGSDLLGLSWRPIFLLNVPIGLLVLLLGSRYVVGVHHTDRQVRLDLVGVFLLTGSMGAILVPLTIGRDQGWPAWTWIVLACGAMLLWVFGRYESTARDPVLDPAALRPTEIRLGMVACCIVMGSYAAFLLSLTVHLQTHLDYGPLQAGLIFVPYAIGFGGLSLSWNSFPRPVQLVLPIAGPIAYAMGILLVVVLFRDHWNAIASSPLLFLAGAGHASGYSPLVAHITEGAKPHLASSISALNSTGPTLSEVIAVAGLGSVYFAAPHSADGLLQLSTAIAVLLGIAMVCAGLAMKTHLSHVAESAESR